MQLSKGFGHIKFGLFIGNILNFDEFVGRIWLIWEIEGVFIFENLEHFGMTDRIFWVNLKVPKPSWSY